MRALPALLVVGLSSVACRPGKPVIYPKNSLTRADFNRLAVRLNIPVYWTEDLGNDSVIAPGEVAQLRFYPTSPTWTTSSGAFTEDFERAYGRILAASKAPPPDPSTAEGKRRALVLEDLDAGRPTLVRTETAAFTPAEQAFVRQMLVVADQIDKLYETMNGARAAAQKLPADPESRSLFRRNRGPKCIGPKTEKDPACSAIPGAPKPIFDIYPAALQATDNFCKQLEAHKDAKALLGHFNVVRMQGNELVAVPYTVAYRDQMTAISKSLSAAAREIDKDPAERALVTYLDAAAASFLSNNWEPADEAWAKMSVDNSKWYVRVGPDEVYWEPCAEKAGVHLSFARINQGSRAWQQKLVPVQQDMENAIAAKAGDPYKPRTVTFHLPDFIDLVVNAGDDRDALGATIGQSLPNWGPVANEGRGRTVAMVNLYTDPDSRAARQKQAESLLDAESIKLYGGTTEPGLLSTILHEATHNLGPAHEYKVDGKDDSEVFTGPVASMMEELKAQTGALFLLEFLRSRKLISDELAQQSFVDAIIWACGHISQGMYTGDGQRKAYGNLAAIHLGTLIDKGAIAWDPEKPAANGTDKGAFTFQSDRLAATADAMMAEFGGIKARGDKAAALALIARYVDSDQVVPHKLIAERFLRQPKANFVFSVAP